MSKWGTFIHWKTLWPFGDLDALPSPVSVQEFRTGRELTSPVSPSVPGGGRSKSTGPCPALLHPPALLSTDPRATEEQDLQLLPSNTPDLSPQVSHSVRTLGTGLREVLILSAHFPDPCSLASCPRTDQQVCGWHSERASGSRGELAIYQLVQKN